VAATFQHADHEEALVITDDQELVAAPRAVWERQREGRVHEGRVREGDHPRGRRSAHGARGSEVAIERHLALAGL
jgi:hypothetical protein